jgi:hypothetical protein
VPARTPPSTFLFLSSLVKEQHRTMRLPKNIRPSDRSRRGRQDVPGSGGADRFGRWRRDEADMAPPVSFVNTGINFCQPRCRPASEDAALLQRQDFDPDRGRAIEARQFRGSVWRRHASAAASMGGYLGRSIPAVNNPPKLFTTVRFRTVPDRKKAPLPEPAPHPPHSRQDGDRSFSIQGGFRPKDFRGARPH